MTSASFLLCLMALLPLFQCMPIPHESGIKIQLFDKGLKQVAVALQPALMMLSDPVPIEFDLDDMHFHGTFHVTDFPTTEFTSLANDMPTNNYEGFEVMSHDDHHHRFRRSAGSATAKVLCKDDEFMAGKQLGGLKTTLTDFEIIFDLQQSTHTYEIKATHLTLDVDTLLGSDDGQLKQALIAAELHGTLEVTKDGHAFEMTQEKRDSYFKKVLELIVRRYHKEFTDKVTGFTHTIGSIHIPHVIFDFRLTEHPQFHDGGVELSMVGKFVYDKNDQYKVSHCDELDQILAVMGAVQMFKTREPVDHSADMKTQHFVLYDDDTTPHIDALKHQGSDMAEEQRRKKASFRMELSEDFINSIFQAAVESGITDMSFTKDQIQGLISLAGPGVEGAGAVLALLPEGANLRLKLNPVPNHKYVHMMDDGKKVEKLSLGIGMGDEAADYTVTFESSFLFRDGSEAVDLTKLTLDKASTTGYPQLFTEESLKDVLKPYYETMRATMMEKELMHVTEIQVVDKHLYIGVDMDAML